MTGREWALKYLTEERDDLIKRISILTSGHGGLHEMREGKFVDITAEAIDHMKSNLATIEQILTRAESEDEDA